MAGAAGSGLSFCSSFTYRAVLTGVTRKKESSFVAVLTLMLTFCVFMLFFFQGVLSISRRNLARQKADVAMASGGQQGRRLRRAFHPCGQPGDGAKKAAA